MIAISPSIKEVFNSETLRLETLTREVQEEAPVRWITSRPITFEEYLTIPEDGKWYELVDGVVVEKPMVQLDHEKLFAWLFTLMNMIAMNKDLGIILGSRTAVPITGFRGRLPDLVFVRKENAAILEQKAIMGVPDLVIELVSPSDSPADLIALETDYRGIGVPEIVFINQKKRTVRTLRKRDNDYESENLTAGILVLEALDGLRLELNWLLDEPRPTVQDVLASIP